MLADTSIDWTALRWAVGQHVADEASKMEKVQLEASWGHVLSLVEDFHIFSSRCPRSSLWKSGHYFNERFDVDVY